MYNFYRDQTTKDFKIGDTVECIMNYPSSKWGPCKIVSIEDRKYGSITIKSKEGKEGLLFPGEVCKIK